MNSMQAHHRVSPIPQHLVAGPHEPPSSTSSAGGGVVDRGDVFGGGGRERTRSRLRTFTSDRPLYVSISFYCNLTMKARAIVHSVHVLPCYEYLSILLHPITLTLKCVYTLLVSLVLTFLVPGT